MYHVQNANKILYGHETWTMLEEDLLALRVFERHVLRMIFGGVQENGVWRRRMNHELVALYGEPSIQKVAKAGRIRWAGHVARIPDNNPAKLVFATDPVGTRRWPKPEGYGGQGMLQECRTTTLQSWCLQLIRLAQEGVERREHDGRTRWSVTWRASGATEDGERQPRTVYYGEILLIQFYLEFDVILNK
ncbi:uncharacterized protein LOC134291957 [Aedes albopictus]|uniref:Uncharacterized protein n=1 Tax=Aedes albopictus TaxID=7160 RepID=A0ABM1Z7D2_AEDAL